MKINNEYNMPDTIVRQAVHMMQEENKGKKLIEITVTPADAPDTYSILPVFEQVFFERIRRITGYLVGTTDKWNDAKRAELRDRVNHEGGEQNQ